jgi:hypothetical protein
MERKHQIIESLLAKPSKKPDFSAFKGSDILKRAQQFMPKFVQTTDRLLSDPELLKTHQMDIKVIDKDAQKDEEMVIDEEQKQGDAKLINMVYLKDNYCYRTSEWACTISRTSTLTTNSSSHPPLSR